MFELLLRLKANYLWPAMWGSRFNEDDPESPRLADEYGIVIDPEIVVEQIVVNPDNNHYSYFGNNRK